MGSGICLAFFLFIAYDYWYYWQIPSLTPDYRNIPVVPSTPRIKFYKLMNILKNSWRKGTKLLSQLLCIGAVFTACTDDEVINQTNKALQVSVSTEAPAESRTIIDGGYLPDGASIGVEAFYKCNSLKEFVMPDAVTTLGEKAFFICSSLSNLTIGKNLGAIGKETFEG